MFFRLSIRFYIFLRKNSTNKGIQIIPERSELICMNKMDTISKANKLAVQCKVDHIYQNIRHCRDYYIQHYYVLKSLGSLGRKGLVNRMQRH